MSTDCNTDNLDLLRRHLETESIDVVYLVPPFNSAQDYYNVLFAERDGTRAAGQIKADHRDVYVSHPRFEVLPVALSNRAV